MKQTAALWLGLSLLVLGPSLSGWPVFAGDPGIDVWSHVWGMAWFADALAHGRVPWEAPGLRHPEGGVLWYIDLLGALVALPWMWLGAHAVGYLAVQVMQVAVAVGGGRALERALGGPGVVAPVALATSPFLMCSWHNGVLEAGWIGLVACTAAAAVTRSRWTGLWLGLSFVATPYLGVASAGVAVVALGSQRAWRLLGITLLVGALVAAPVAVGLAASFDDPRSLAIKPPPGPRWPTWRINAVDPRAFWMPGDFWSVPLQGDGAPPFRRTPYLGWTLLLAAGWAVRLDRKRAVWGLCVAAGMVLALGPVLSWAGELVDWPGGGPVFLPFGWVLHMTGVGMDHPLRFITLAIVPLAGLAGASVRGRGTWAWGLAACVAVEHLVLAPSPWPLHTSAVAVPEVYAWLDQADGAAGTGVIDLPADLGGTMQTSRYLYWHAVHERPLPYGNKVSGSLIRVDNAALKAWTQPVPPRRVEPVAVRELAKLGYGWVVLHPEMCVDGCSALEASLTQTLGVATPVGGRLVWALQR